MLKAQECQHVDSNSKRHIYEQLAFLASDELEGRAPGSRGIELAKQYIEREFEKNKLLPINKESYAQAFEVPNTVVSDVILKIKGIKGTSLQFYVCQYSSNGTVEGKTLYVSYGIESSSPTRDDVDDKKIKDKIAVMEIGSPDGIHPHSAYINYHDLFTRISNLKEKGAIAVILVDSEGNNTPPKSSFKRINNSGVPVVFVSDPNTVSQLVKKSHGVNLSTDLKPTIFKTHNLIGKIDNGAKKTIIIGAHYDHLGLGGESSLYRGDNPDQIHNGADDNGSGTVGLLQLAKFLSNTENELFKRHNFLFIAFSGEEMGLLGSSYFVESELFDKDAYLYMVNMDMIGRMEEQKVQVNGVGTSDLWRDLLKSANCKLELNYSESGVGPSDHTSFYYKDLPVLHFFTGTHKDYHKPSDDIEKVNINGIYAIVNVIAELIANSPDSQMNFTPTKNEQYSAPKFSVTLGILPDYFDSENGLKVDGVTDGKPASKAGMQAGDIITKLGDVMVSDIKSYMQALSTFKAGDEVDLEYVRNGQTITTKVQF